MYDRGSLEIFSSLEGNLIRCVNRSLDPSWYISGRPTV
jgi:hypothetical protein